jgi:nucleolar protein 53
MLASISTARALRTSAVRTRSEREQERALKKLAVKEKLKHGLAGVRLGRHKVPEGELEVQLGEDLSESLRGLKVGSDHG